MRPGSERPIRLSRTRHRHRGGRYCRFRARVVRKNRWRHDEQGQEHGHAVAGAARCRPPRSDPRAGRAREQPQRRQHRDREAPADGVHRRFRLGQELAGVRHDRRGVAAAHQRDLQRVRTGIHADTGTARGRRARWPHDRDHRRPGANGGQRPLHGRHGHRCQRDAAHPLQPTGQAAHRPAQCVLVQRAFRPCEWSDHRRARLQDEDREGDVQPSRWDVPALRGHGISLRLRPVCAVRRQQVAQRGRTHDPRLQHGGLVRPHLPRVRLLRPRQADPQVHQEGVTRPPLQRGDQDQGRRDQSDVCRADPDDPEVVPLQRRRRDAAAHPRVRGAGHHIPDLSRVRWHPARRAGPIVEDQRQEHRRRVCDADQRSGRLVARFGRIVGRAVVGRVATRARFIRRDRTRLPLTRPAHGHVVGRRVTAHQDDPPSRLFTHRRDLRVRRADGRPAPARHCADERPAAAAAGQGQHRVGRGAQARGDRDRGPRRRSRPRRRLRRGRGGVRGHGRRVAGQRNHHRPSLRRPRLAEAIGADIVRSARSARRDARTTCATSTSTSRSACWSC